MKSEKVLTAKFEKITVKKQSLHLLYSIDGNSFDSHVNFASVDLEELEKRFGFDHLMKIYVANFIYDLTRLACIGVRYIDLGEYHKYASKEAIRVHAEAAKHFQGEWRYIHQLPNFPGISILEKPDVEFLPSEPITLKFENEKRALMQVGGGKDSYAGTNIIQEIGLDFDIVHLVFSSYGESQFQTEIVDKVIEYKKNSTSRIHRIELMQTFTDSEYRKSFPYKITNYDNQENQHQFILSILIILYYNLAYCIQCNERTSDYPNLKWDLENGNEINHQWGKSLEAETLFHDYYLTEFVSNIGMFSIIKPIRDAVIFYAARSNEDGFEFCHSCNLVKPWCGECAKCCYVLMNYMAFMSKGKIEEMMKTFLTPDLFDCPKNQLFFRQLLGYEKHTPFECVGQKEDTYVAMLSLVSRGYTGKALDLWKDLKVSKETLVEYIDEVFRVDEENQFFPVELKDKILAALKKHAKEGKDEMLAYLK